MGRKNHGQYNRSIKHSGNLHMRVEEEFAGILYSIESAIVAVFDSRPDLVDKDVLVAIEALIREYEREKRNRPGMTLVPPGQAKAVFEECRRVCEERLGRNSLTEGEASLSEPREGEVSVPELMRCLKRLRKSVRLWHKQGGHQGYLTYVRRFIAGKDAALRI